MKTLILISFLLSGSVFAEVPTDSQKNIDKLSCASDRLGTVSLEETAVTTGDQITTTYKINGKEAGCSSDNCSVISSAEASIYRSSCY